MTSDPSPSFHPHIPPLRQPVLHWLLIVITFTVYGYVWAFLIMRDVNRLGGERQTPVKKLIGVFCFLYLLYLAALAAGISWVNQSVEAQVDLLPGWLMPTGLLIGALAIATICYGLVRAAGNLRALGLKSAPDALLIVITTIFYMISLPLLQSRLNQISKTLQTAENEG